MEKYKGKGKQNLIEESLSSDNSDSRNESLSGDDVSDQREGASTPVHAPIVETQPSPLAEIHVLEHTRTEIHRKVVNDPLADKVPRVVPIIAPDP